MDDLAACAEFCEEHGFAAPAAALRALAQGKAPFYLVRARMKAEFAEDEGFDPADLNPPVRQLFHDRGAAEKHARTLTARALRNFRVNPSHDFPTSLDAGGFLREVDAILGITYDIPKDGRAFPEWATDEQLWRISQHLYHTLFDVARFGTKPVE